MKPSKDPAIKLFGMSIVASPPVNGKVVPNIAGCSESEDVVCESVVAANEPIGSDSDSSSLMVVMECLDDKKVSQVVGGDKQQAQKDPMVEDPLKTRQKDLTSPLITENLRNPEAAPGTCENPNTPSIEEDKTENDQSDTNDSQGKTLKKPDKIIACPRCNSMDTKFCYYNNYNVNQPRYFCKSCQRYWTSGGSMRNVPVGAGRRKSKNSNSSFRHITISDVLQAAQIEIPIETLVKANGTVLSFGADSRICESVAPVLNLAEKKSLNGIRNGTYRIRRGSGVKANDCSTGPSVMTNNSMNDRSQNGYQDPTIRNMNRSIPPIPCLPGVPWPYPVPALYPPGFPISVYPPPYWNSGFPGTWAIPCLAPITPITPNSPNLGKHSREGDLIKPINAEQKDNQEPNNSERSILIPKTLRIDDPEEAAKSSIWATLGIENEILSRGGIFKGFESKGEKKSRVAETCPTLRANPAAFSRSLTFQEGS